MPSSQRKHPRRRTTKEHRLKAFLKGRNRDYDKPGAKEGALQNTHRPWVWYPGHFCKPGCQENDQQEDSSQVLLDDRCALMVTTASVRSAAG